MAQDQQPELLKTIIQASQHLANGDPASPAAIRPVTDPSRVQRNFEKAQQQKEAEKDAMIKMLDLRWGSLAKKRRAQIDEFLAEKANTQQEPKQSSSETPAYIAQHQGNREYQEDAVVSRLFTPRTESVDVAQLAKASLMHLGEYFVEDQARLIRQNKRLDCDYLGGSTACLAFYDSATHKITIANIGDSRALVIFKKGAKYEVVPLTWDQSLKDEQEKQRIPEQFHYLDRLCESSDPNVLFRNVVSVTRALGDSEFGAAGITYTPEISEYQFNEAPDEAYIFIHSDGMILTPDEIEHLLNRDDQYKVLITKLHLVLRDLSVWTPPEIPDPLRAPYRPQNSLSVGDNISMILMPLQEITNRQIAYGAVFDGHGGDSVSKAAAKMLPTVVEMLEPILTQSDENKKAAVDNTLQLNKVFVTDWHYTGIRIATRHPNKRGHSQILPSGIKEIVKRTQKGEKLEEVRQQVANRKYYLERGFFQRLKRSKITATYYCDYKTDSTIFKNYLNSVKQKIQNEKFFGSKIHGWNLWSGTEILAEDEEGVENWYTAPHGVTKIYRIISNAEKKAGKKATQMQELEKIWGKAAFDVLKVLEDKTLYTEINGSPGCESSNAKPATFWQKLRHGALFRDDAVNTFYLQASRQLTQLMNGRTTDTTFSNNQTGMTGILNRRSVV